MREEERHKQQSSSHKTKNRLYVCPCFLVSFVASGRPRSTCASPPFTTLPLPPSLFLVVVRGTRLWFKASVVGCSEHQESGLVRCSMRA